MISPGCAKCQMSPIRRVFTHQWTERGPMGVVLSNWSRPGGNPSLVAWMQPISCICPQRWRVTCLFLTDTPRHRHAVSQAPAAQVVMAHTTREKWGNGDNNAPRVLMCLQYWLVLMKCGINKFRLFLEFGMDRLCRTQNVNMDRNQRQ